MPVPEVQCEKSISTKPDEEMHMDPFDPIDEGAVARCPTMVRPPTETERRQHALTHLPFRAWCRHCVAARAANSPHRVPVDRGDLSVPSVSYDYCFLRNATGSTSATTLVSRDRDTGLLAAHVVPCKGSDAEWVVKQAIRDLERMGIRGKVVLKSDQEPAIVEMLNDVARRRDGAQTILEHAPRGDSQANGRAERAVRTTEEFVRVFKFELEQRLDGKEIDVQSAVFEWLVEHAVDVVNKFLVGIDGRTAFQRLKGKTYRGETLPFCAKVMYRVCGKVPGGLLVERWFPGVWLGKRFSSEEHLVARLSDGLVFRCRAVRMLPEKTHLDDLLKIEGRPWCPAGAAQIERPPRPMLDDPIPAPIPVDQPAAPRAAQITKEMLDKVGYTPSCAKCRAVRNGWRNTAGHSKHCREEVERKLREDEQYKDKFAKADERRDNFLAEEAQRSTKCPRVEAQSAPSSDEQASTPATTSTSTKRASTTSTSSGASSSSTPAQPEETTQSDDQRGDGPADEMPIPSADSDEPSAKKARVEEPEQDRNHPGAPSSSPSLPGGDMQHDPAMGDVEEMPSKKARLYAILSCGAAIPADEVPNSHAEELEEFLEMGEELWSTDVSGLSPEAVRLAKQEELDRFRKLGVYKKVTRQHMKEQLVTDGNAVLVDTKWVVTNKGTADKPIPKARLVAREYANDRRHDLFAGTPGIQLVRYVVSTAMTAKPGVKRKLMCLDIKTAFLYGKARRQVFLELPDEDPDCGDLDCVGQLVRSLYGTRDAPQIWSDLFAEAMIKWGFSRSKLMPGVFYRKEKDLLACGHVDDVICSGSSENLRWLQDMIAQEFEFKATVIGPDEFDKKEATFLGRRLTWTSNGIYWEADEKHAMELLREYGLMECNSVSTPLSNETDKNLGQREDRELMGVQEARRHRGSCARLNYLAQDRPDLAATACCLAKTMATPRQGDELIMKRAVRYLNGHRRGAFLFEQQGDGQELQLWSDSDWATCRTTRRSQSGGALLHGCHVIKFWSRVQGRVASSSGEAEFLAAYHGLNELIQLHNVIGEFKGSKWSALAAHLDASAAASLLQRHGVGAIKSLQVKDMWAQEAVSSYAVDVRKVPRSVNFADLMASACGAQDFHRHLDAMNFTFV